MANEVGTRSQNVFLNIFHESARINGKKIERVRVRDGTFYKVREIWAHILGGDFFEQVSILAKETLLSEMIR